MSTLSAGQCSTFYEALQQCEGLDLRDNRGKIHAVELVLTGVSEGILRVDCTVPQPGWSFICYPPLYPKYPCAALHSPGHCCSCAYFQSTVTPGIEKHRCPLVLRAAV